MALNNKEEIHFWRELERVEQWLGTGASAAAGRIYDTMGRPGAQTFANYGNEIVASVARVERVRQALDQSGPMAKRLAMQQLSGIGLDDVWDILLAACKEIALYYGGAVVTGAVVGGAIGSLAFGAGAVPGAMVGGAAGSQVGIWVLTLLGLKELVVGLGTMFPAAMEHYVRGFREAWGAVPDNRRDFGNSAALPSGSISAGAWHMGQGHVILVTAILTAVVAYLTRGGTTASLAQMARQSRRLGARFANWAVENERRLLAHPQLQSRPNNSIAIARDESSSSGRRDGAAARNFNKVDTVGATVSSELAAQAGGASGKIFPRTEGLGTHSTIANLRATGALPGEQGVIITDRTIRFGDIYELGTLGGRNVEFSLVTEYSNGSLVKKLYSGDAWTSPVPRDARLIGHVHPNENAFKLWPSPQDMNMVNARYFRELMINPDATPVPSRIFWGPGDTDNTIFYPGFGKSPVSGKGG